MIPLRLELHNFMSYRDTCVVDLDGVHVACLTGDNGAGKSALLDAMTWALWGKSRAKSDRDLITLRETDMRVEFDFQLGGQQFKILRARTGASQRLSLEIFVRHAQEGDWEPITGDNASATQRKIEALLRMDYETFTNSAFLLQGQADAFTQKTPGERKRILGEILGLDDYDELAALAREREREARQRSGLLRERIEELDRQIDEEQGVKNELGEASETVDRLDREIVDADRDLRTVATELELLKAIEQSRSRAAERRSGLAREREQTAKRLAGDERNLNEARQVIQRASDIEAGYAALVSARTKRDKAAETLRQRRPVEERIAGLKTEIEREQRRIEHENQRRIDRRQHLIDQQQARETTSRELEEQTLAAKTIDEELAAFGSPEQERSTIQEQIGRLEAESKSLRAEMDDIVARIAAIDDGEATCPICRRPLAEGEHEHIRHLWEQDGKTLGDRYRAHQSRLKELRKELRAIDDRVNQLQMLRTRKTQAATRIEQLNREVAASAEVEKEINVLNREISESEDTLKKGDFALKQREQLQSFEAQLSQLPYDPDAHKAAHEEVSKLEQYEAEHQALTQARERETTLAEAIKERGQRIEDIDKQLAQVDQELAELDERLQTADKTRARHQELESSLKELNEERTKAAETRAALQAKLNQIEEARNERRATQAQVRGLSQDADAYRELTAAFGRNGIQAMIINNVIPEIQEEANSLLRRMSSSMLEVRLDTSRTGRTTGQLIDTLDITIQDESGQRPYEMYSGGEAFRIDFAIRVALSRLLARRAGATIDLLVIDEGFGTQDSRGRDGLVEALHSVQDDFDMLLVITHVDEIRDMFPTRIDVVKTTNGSRVTVN